MTSLVLWMALATCFLLGAKGGTTNISRGGLAAERGGLAVERGAHKLGEVVNEVSTQSDRIIANAVEQAAHKLGEVVNEVSTQSDRVIANAVVSAYLLVFLTALVAFSLSQSQK